MEPATLVAVGLGLVAALVAVLNVVILVVLLTRARGSDPPPMAPAALVEEDDEEDEVSVPRFARWLSAPKVLVHLRVSGGTVEPSCGLPLERIEVALTWWRSHGYALGKPQVTTSKECPSGSILILGWGQGPTAAATRISSTRLDDGVRGRLLDGHELAPGDYYCRPEEIVTFFDDGQIHHAVVALPKGGRGLNLDRLLIHQLGHALGFGHAGSVPMGAGAAERVQGHVLSALASEGGWNDSGLRRTAR